VKSAFRQSFARDLKNIKDRNVPKRVAQVIAEAEIAGTLREIPNLKK
jgi:hypothetical protein